MILQESQDWDKLINRILFTVPINSDGDSATWISDFYIWNARLNVLACKLKKNKKDLVSGWLYLLFPLSVFILLLFYD